MFEDRAFLILGATGSVGRALSRQLAAAGARLLLAGRNDERRHALAAELDAPETAVDVCVPGQIDTAVEETRKRYERIDGIAHCVGSLLLKPAHLTSDEELDDQINVHLRSAFAVVRAAAKAMRKEGGSVVLFTSAAARIGLANHEAIAAAKGGVTGLTLSAAASYARYGIRVNAVAPGMVESEMTRSLVEDDAVLRVSTELHALGRIGKPEDVAACAAWLLDPSNDWVTGQVFGVDGGLSRVRTRSRS